MSVLRNTHSLARFVLVWFALSLGVAVATPLVQPQEWQLVCSAVGNVSLVATEGGDATPADTPLPDCPLCAGTGILPSFAAARLGLAAPQLHATPLHNDWPLGLVSAAPPPGRGPPLCL